MKMKISTLVSVGAIILAAGCCRYTDYTDPDDLNSWTQARVVYKGAPEVDGCGWMIRVGEEYFYAVNLDDVYKVDGLDVKIRYTYDPVEFRCGIAGTRYQSIRITDIRIDAEPVQNLTERNQDRLPMDGYRMDSVYLNGDFLFLLVSFGGGCRQHDFNLWKLPPNSLDPPPVELMLSHDANDDNCYALVTEWLVFSLKPLRERDKHEVTFLLRGSPEMSAYFGRYVYKY